MSLVAWHFVIVGWAASFLVLVEKTNCVFFSLHGVRRASVDLSFRLHHPLGMVDDARILAALENEPGSWLPRRKSKLQLPRIAQDTSIPTHGHFLEQHF